MGGEVEEWYEEKVIVNSFKKYGISNIINNNSTEDDDSEPNGAYEVVDELADIGRNIKQK